MNKNSIENFEYHPEQPGSLNYYDSDSDGNFPAANYYVRTFGKMFNYYHITDDLKISFIKVLEEEGYKVFRKYDSIIEGNNKPTQTVYVKDETMIVVFYERDDEKKKPSSLCMDIFYQNLLSIENILKKVKRYTKKEEKGGNISLVMQESHGLVTRQFPVKENDVDIALHYGESFKKEYDHIVEKLNVERGKGLVLFHGIPGSGKTSLIRLLATKVKKEVLFIPPMMAESIADPSFITFLMKHANSILIIEDAEKVVLDRETDGGMTMGVSNILNITDGILSDCLGIQVIATFNTTRERIDKALLRKGRLLSEWKFDALSQEESDKLLFHLGKPANATGPMTLADIYLVDEEVNVVKKVKKNTIGFTRN